MKNHPHSLRSVVWITATAIFGMHAFAATLVVPNTNAQVAGNDSSGPLTPPLSNFRGQIVINPGQFPADPVYITGFTWRARPGLGALNVNLSGSIYLSTSPNYANTGAPGPLLSTTFANNVGPDNTLVATLSNFNMSGAACATPGPCPWANNITFTTPFLYHPGNGPLLIDIKSTSFGGPGPGQFDVIDCSAATCVVSNVDGTLGSPTASQFNFGSNITRITYTLPPSDHTTTYLYQGTPFTDCNGTAPVNGNCPANYASDYDIASMTFAAPLAANLSSVNVADDPNLIAWTIRDDLGYVSYSSSASNPPFYLFTMVLSTDATGKISAWDVRVSNKPFGQPGTLAIGIDSPTFTNANSQPEADFLVTGPNGSSEGYALGNAIPGQWNEVPLSMNVSVDGVTNCGNAALGFPADSWSIDVPPPGSQGQILDSLVTKELDLCSPQIFHLVVAGQHVDTVTLRESQGGNVSTIWTLSEVIDPSYRIAWSASNEAPVESLSFDWTTAKEQVVRPPAAPGGGSSAVIAGVSTTTLEINGICPSFSASSWSLGVLRPLPLSETSGSGNRKIASSTTYLSVSKPIDSCSPSLANASANGTHFVKATLTTQTSSGYTLKLTLTAGKVIEDHVSGAVETLSLTFQSIEMQVNNVAAGFDFATQKAI